MVIHQCSGKLYGNPSMQWSVIAWTRNAMEIQTDPTLWRGIHVLTRRLNGILFTQYVLTRRLNGILFTQYVHLYNWLSMSSGRKRMEQYTYWWL